MWGRRSKNERPEPRGEWSEVEIGGHGANVYRPPEINEHGYLLLYLHGVHLGNLRDHPEFAVEFDRHRLPVIAPVTQRSWWTDRICAEFDPAFSAERHVIERVLPNLASEWGAQPPRIGLFGTSMGGQGALRFAFKHPNKFPVVAAIAPAIDYHLRLEEGDEILRAMYADAEEARQDTATLHIHPLNWPRNIWFCCDPTDYFWSIGAERLAMKLSALGIPYERELEIEAGGHDFKYYRHMAKHAVAFLAERLERERLRVV